MSRGPAFPAAMRGVRAHPASTMPVDKRPLFTRDFLLNQTPSRKDGVDLAKEQQFRRTYCNFLKKIVQELKL